MKVISWNLGYWQYRKFHDKAWEYIREEIQPKLALLQEIKPPKLRNDEFMHFVPIHHGWGTAIYSHNIPLEGIAFKDYLGHIAHVQCKMRNVNIDLISIHAPIINGRVFPHLSNIFDKIESLIENRTFIIGGDLNSARLAEKVWPGYGHGPFFERLSEGPFFDCMRKFHDEEQQTFFRKGVQHPWQDDHLFVNHDLADKILSCDVLNNDFTKMVSDHIPIITEIDL